jgi:hypothetical protein
MPMPVFTPTSLPSDRVVDILVEATEGDDVSLMVVFHGAMVHLHNNPTCLYTPTQHAVTDRRGSHITSGGPKKA